VMRAQHVRERRAARTANLLGRVENGAHLVPGRKLSLSEKATKEQWETNLRPLAIDKTYYDDFCSLSHWGQKDDNIPAPIDFKALTWTDGLKAIDPKLVDAPPPPC